MRLHSLANSLIAFDKNCCEAGYTLISRLIRSFELFWLKLAKERRCRFFARLLRSTQQVSLLFDLQSLCTAPFLLTQPQVYCFRFSSALCRRASYCCLGLTAGSPKEIPSFICRMLPVVAQPITPENINNNN